MAPSRIARSIFCLAWLSSQAPQPPPGAGRGPVDAWAGKKRLLVIADPEEWYGVQNYHHQAASHAMATIERIGRESGVYVSMIRTDMRLITKAAIAGANARNLDYFDAIFYMGEGPWNITDQQKADLLSFVHDDGKGFFAAHAGNGGSLILWPEYADMIGGNLTAEFTSLEMPIIVEDPKFPGMDAFPREFTFTDQFTIVGPIGSKGATARAAPNYTRDKVRVIMRLDGTKSTSQIRRMRESLRSFVQTKTFLSFGQGSMARAGFSTLLSDMRTIQWMICAFKKCTWERSSG